MLNDLRKLSKSECIELYRDDGLIITNRSNCEQERISKNLRSIFEEHSFHITIKNGVFQTDFLHVKLKLRDNIYGPFKNENNESNRPKTTIKYIKPMINPRLHDLSSDIQVFNDKVNTYNEALENGGFDNLNGYINCEYTKKN